MAFFKAPSERAHHDWLGMVQPDGLVVTATALKSADANITWPVTELQQELAVLAGEAKIVLETGRFLREILGWSSEFLVTDIPDSLRVPLDDGEHLAPKFALRSADDPTQFVMLVHVVDRWRAGLDDASDDKRWTATPHQKFERLLRETAVHVGLLTNGSVFRLVYAPKAESAGWIDFRVADLLTVDGRPLLGALHMLLNEPRLLALEPEKRLSGLLKASREYQNTVSNALREQILAALRELLRGFEHADGVSKGALLGELRREHRQEIYLGLVTVLMRMVFVLFAEERDLLPMSESALYADGYSLTRLYAQLSEDRGRFGEGLDDRYGAWARVITLFRLLHDGVHAADGTQIPPRKGDFFNPDKYAFLEGRRRGSARQIGEVLEVPRVSDGVVYTVLDKLLVLGGERLQYRGLDVEQIGSVYEGLMGFELEVAEGPSLCLMPDHVVVNLEPVLALSGAERVKALKSDAGLDLKDRAAGEVKAATTIESLQAALARRISSRQPGLIPLGGLFLQPGEERRKSGSHYTPKSLTGPIVETTLRPVLERLGADVKPSDLLDLKICDPAMGSAAFLVEACRQLADHLVSAWRRTDTMPELPRDEEPVLHARRLIAQRCLYGVDKNPLAVDLARLSLWLVTFAKNHPFTFVDHALRCGDSLVGLSREQIASLSLEVGKGAQLETVRQAVIPAVERAMQLRGEIHAIGDPPDTARLVELWRETNDALDTVRALGDLVIATYFAHDSDKARKKALDELATNVRLWLATGAHDAELRGMRAELREGDKGIEPFHWEIEFPEVFGRENRGFDCFVGNPPFIAGSNISPQLGFPYHAWLNDRFDQTTGNVDLCAFFFRRAFELSHPLGAAGLVATNTIAQGDTRLGGLWLIKKRGGQIFAAQRRLRWPGTAGVVVSVVHIARSLSFSAKRLDGVTVPDISAFLFGRGGDDEPKPLRSNVGKSSLGSKVWGAGFTFEDGVDEADDGPNPISLAHELRAADARYSTVIQPYMGGEELNNEPQQRPSRMVINFGMMTEPEARRFESPFAIVERKVRPVRAKVLQRDRRELWWLHGSRSPELNEYLRTHERCVAIGRMSKHLAFAFVSSGTVFADSLALILADTPTAFGVLTSRPHESWSRLLASTMKDDLRYTPTDCFDTFPFPIVGGADCLTATHPALEAVAADYLRTRAGLMVANNEGLTKTYNRFHDPNEHSPAIQKLRDLHAEMDRAVLDAYGWTDLKPVYDFREQLDESTRLTWDDDTRDEVLARLLELNRVRYEEEQKGAPKPEPKKRAAKKPKGDGGPMLPGVG